MNCPELTIKEIDARIEDLKKGMGGNFCRTLPMAEIKALEILKAKIQEIDPQPSQQLRQPSEP